MIKQNEFDVIVIGAGPAGLSVALKLYSLGRKVAVISKIRSYDREQLETIPNLDILSHVFSFKPLHGPGIVDLGRPGISCWSRVEIKNNPVIVVDRSKLDPLLIEYSTSIGIIFFTSNEISLHKVDDSIWKVQIDKEIFLSRYVVDATGRNSAFTKRREIVPWKQVGIVTEVEINNGCHSLWTESLPLGWIWIIKGRGRNSWLSMFLDEASLTLGAAEIWKKAINTSLIRNEMNLISSNFIAQDLTPSAVNSLFNNGLVSLGDAALSRDPLGSQGLSVAVSDGQAIGVAINNLLVDSSKFSIVKRFLESKHQRAINQHITFLKESYSDSGLDTHFWNFRKDRNVIPNNASFPVDWNCPMIKSNEWKICEEPILEDNDIRMATCLQSSTNSIRWIGTKTVDEIFETITPLQSVRSIYSKWIDMNFEGPVAAKQILNYLTQQKILIPANIKSDILL